MHYILTFTEFTQLSGLRTRKNPRVNTRQRFKLDKYTTSRSSKFTLRLRLERGIYARQSQHNNEFTTSHNLDGVYEERLPARISRDDIQFRANRFAHFTRNVLASLFRESSNVTRRLLLLSRRIRRIRTEFEVDVVATRAECTTMCVPRAFCRDWRERVSKANIVSRRTVEAEERERPSCLCEPCVCIRTRLCVRAEKLCGGDDDTRVVLDEEEGRTSRTEPAAESLRRQIILSAPRLFLVAVRI